MLPLHMTAVCGFTLHELRLIPGTLDFKDEIFLAAANWQAGWVSKRRLSPHVNRAVTSPGPIPLSLSGVRVLSSHEMYEIGIIKNNLESSHTSCS